MQRVVLQDSADLHHYCTGEFVLRHDLQYLLYFHKERVLFLLGVVPMRLCLHFWDYIKFDCDLIMKNSYLSFVSLAFSEIYGR